MRSGLIEEGMRVLGLRCALPDSNGSEHGLGWLRRVSYPGHSKLPTITKVKRGGNNPLELLLSHQESGSQSQKNIGSKFALSLLLRAHGLQLLDNNI